MSAKRAIIKTFNAIGVTTGLNPAKVSGSMAASITGPTTTVDVVDNICFQVAWTSSDAVGVIAVQGSVDGTTFYDLTFDPVLTQPASNNGGYLINLGMVPFTYVRLHYQRTSGTGALTATMSVKGL